jgi:FKBP-type peptidyl-prolyl cis-trans isomerase FklB
MAAIGLALIGCQGHAQDKVKLDNQMDKVSYSIGLDIGKSFKQQGIEINTVALIQGIKDALAGTQPMMSDTEIQSCMEAFQTEMMNKQNPTMKDAGDKNTKDGEAFLADNKKKDGVVTTASGLQYKVITAGSGPKPKPTDTVTVHYRGTLIDGKVFDSSYDRKEPATFPVNGVIQGWQEALQLMPVGSKYELYIPANLAYGARGAGQDIGPNSVLVFQVELLAIK